MFFAGCLAGCAAVVLEQHPSWFLIVGSTFLVLFGVWITWDSFKMVTVRADHLRRVIVVRTHRWPLASLSQTLPLDHVRDAVVEFDGMQEGGQRRVALVLATGEKVPLATSYCSGRRHHERAAGEIQALLLAVDWDRHEPGAAVKPAPD